MKKGRRIGTWVASLPGLAVAAYLMGYGRWEGGMITRVGMSLATGLFMQFVALAFVYVGGVLVVRLLEHEGEEGSASRWGMDVALTPAVWAVCLMWIFLQNSQRRFWESVEGCLSEQGIYVDVAAELKDAPADELDGILAQGVPYVFELCREAADESGEPDNY